MSAHARPPTSARYWPPKGLCDAMLSDGFHDIPAGRVAAVVTHLSMTAPADLRPGPSPEGLSLARIEGPETGWYRDLFSRVGAQDWLWFSRLAMTKSELGAILGNPLVEVWALSRDDQAEGLLELDFREPGACELAFFGVAPGLIGTGAGRFLMNAAIDRAWNGPRDIELFHVHTCTLDSPGALSFYRRSGFVPHRQQIEIAPDPRLTGILPEEAATHVPLFRG